MSRSQLILAVSASAIVIFLVLVFTGVIPGLRPDPSTLPPPPTPTQINVWGFRSDEVGFNSVISSYKASHPNIHVNFVGVDFSSYESKLIDNLAAGTGPDIFMLQNSLVPKYKNKISIAPADIINPVKVFELFPPIVAADFVSGTQIWGLPLSIDTLALAYNRATLDSKQIAQPPATWEELKTMVPRLKESSGGVITKSAVALGGGEASVKNAVDIFSAMLLQLKNKIIDFGTATIAEGGTGLQALNLYTGFSDPNSSSYTWSNAGAQNSINSFADGKTAMIFAYKRDVNDIKLKKPDLNLAIAPLPQFDMNNAISLANYWGLVVSTQSKNQAAAWDFINYATTNSDAAKSYVTGSGMPPALRELIPAYQSDPLMRVFVSQALAAKSVPLLQYPPVLEALNDMIESTLVNRSSAEVNLRAAAQRINTIIQQ